MPVEISPPRHHAIRVVPPAAPGSSVLRTLAVVAACVFVLYVAREVCIPLVLAILLAFVLSPIINLLRHWRLPRVPSILVTVVLALGIILAVGGTIGVQVADLGGQLPKLQTSVQGKITELQNGSLGRIATVVHNMQAALHGAGSQTGAAPPTVQQTPTASEEKALLVRLPPEQEASPLTVVWTLLGPVMSPLSTTGIVLIVVIFMLLQREDLRDRMIRLFGSHDLNKTTQAMNDAAHRLSLYFLAQVGVNATFGLVIGTGLAIIGLPSAILWGILAMLLRFVPYIGIALAAALPLALAAAVGDGWSLVVKTAILFAVAEGLTSQVVEPLLYGRSTGLSPFAVIVAALFWGWLWGPIGLILSTPFTVAVVVLGRHVQHLQFLDVLLGDEPALTPVQSFYQRILAGDTDEARDHAEELLGTRTLCSYYDDVAVQALRLATIDMARGALGGEALVTMQRSLRELVDDLGYGEHLKLKVTPPPSGVPVLASPKGPQPECALQAVDPAALAPEWRGPGAVLCVAGRGSLDEEAAAILVQLLGKHNLTARLAPHAAVSRQGIADLDVANVAMVCLMHVEISGHPPHLRYLVERVRARLPGRSIVVGLWSIEDTDASEDRARKLGADRIAISLHEIVEACLDEARAASSKAVAA